MRNTITYRHWQPGDDGAILAFLPNTDEDWYRNKFDDPDIEPEGICLAFNDEKVVGHAMGESTLLFIEEKVQEFGIVSAVFVAPDMRRQGIATCLMDELHAYFLKKGYRGTILNPTNAGAYQLYKKIGYQETGKELRTQLSPRSNPSRLKWTGVNREDLDVLHQLKKKWATYNFPVYWHPQDPEVQQDNMEQYRVLWYGTSIVGYAECDEPSEHCPEVLIQDPIVPDFDPIEVVASVQAAILTPRVWQTAEGSRFEMPLRSLNFPLEPTQEVDMFLPLGPEIDLTKHYHTL